MVKLIAWNTARCAEAWRYLLDTGADIALVQEATGPTAKFSSLGFRVASLSIPEPSSLLLGALAGMGLLLRRRTAG